MLEKPESSKATADGCTRHHDCGPASAPARLAAGRRIVRHADFVAQARQACDLTFDPTASVMSCTCGWRTRLTGKEIALVEHLLAAFPVPVTTEQLRCEVWRQHPDTVSHTVETHVYRLRKKIEKNTRKPRYILTTKQGYLLAADFCRSMAD